MFRALVFTLATLAAAQAAAQTSTYQNRLIGQRALGMGGAFTGIADDPSATYYNPAALSNLSALQLEVGLPVVAIDQTRLYGGLISGAGKSSDALSALALPTMLGVAAGAGPKDATGNERLTLALSLLIPWQKQLFFRQGLQSDQASAIHFVQESEQTLMLGASLSARLGIFSIGVSLYYIHENFSWLNSRSGSSSLCDGGGAEGSCVVQQTYDQSTQLEGFFGALNPRLGLLLKPTDNFSIGVMTSFSSFRMWGAGGFKTGTTSADGSGVTGQRFFATDSLVIDRPLPWEVRVGVGLSLKDKFHFAGDVTFYFPQRFRMLRGVPEDVLIYPADVQRLFVVNGNIGFEYMIRPTIPLRFGFFTNFTSAPPPAAECEAVACLPWQHSAGVTASVGAQLWRVKLDFGAITAYGRGFMQQPDPQGPTRFRWAENDQLQIQLFIGGNLGKVLNETAMEIKQRIEDLEEKRRKALMKEMAEELAASQPTSQASATVPEDVPASASSQRHE